VTWKSWIPYYGDRTVRKKLRELDSAGIGAPMIIILFLQKTFELILKELGTELPIPLWFTFLLATTFTFTLYVYQNQLSQAKDKAKEKVEDDNKL